MAKSAHKSSKKKKLTSEEFRQRLKLKHLEVKRKLSEKHPKVHKFFKSKGLDPGKIREHSAKILGASAITGALLFSPPLSSNALPTPQEIIEKLKSDKNLKLENKQSLSLRDKQSLLLRNKNINLANSLAGLLPKKPRPLSRNEEKILEQVFSQVLGVLARGTLEGEHLNTTYGYIGAEQHLRRYPGDTLLQHAPAPDGAGYNSGEILKEGMAPGLGAWGYFATSKEELTADLEETERWYAVVQTMYLPDWNKRLRYLRDWYKYRKVLIVNTENGNAVVAAIADSGPAAWTGKHFGGSPEVMHYLGGPRYKKGPVVIFFVDDPENKVPLGPVDY